MLPTQRTCTPSRSGSFCFSRIQERSQRRPLSMTAAVSFRIAIPAPENALSSTGARLDMLTVVSWGSQDPMSLQLPTMQTLLNTAGVPGFPHRSGASYCFVWSCSRCT